jgi:hypothetical protein
MDSIKEKVEKVNSNRRRLLELKAEVLRLEKIIKDSEENNDGNLREEEYGGLKSAHKEARELIAEIQIEKVHWREMSKIILN